MFKQSQIDKLTQAQLPFAFLRALLGTPERTKVTSMVYRGLTTFSKRGF